MHPFEEQDPVPYPIPNQLGGLALAAHRHCSREQKVSIFTTLDVLHVRSNLGSLECAAREVKDNLCRIIDEAKASIVPKMAVFNEKLWQVQYERGGQALNKVPNGEFESLEQLLRPAPGNGPSQISSIDMKERIILCFTLVTSFFHIFSMNNEWLQASITSSHICFRTSTRYLNIIKPYLNIAFREEQTKPTARRPEEIHWFPSILTLGIMLLEISRGSKIEFVPGEDDCVTALAVYEKWKDVAGKLCSSTIPEGLFNTILSCIDPNELRKGSLDRPNIGDMEIRKYIFERILYPLGDAISSIYKVPLHKLHDEKAQGEGTEAIDEQQIDSDKQLAGKQWRRHLESLHDIFYHHHVKGLLKTKLADVAIKIAVLDTGFQLDEALQENYKAEGRIVAAQCKSFCSQDHDNRDWDVDIDGHGTYVGQIVLDVAPTSELYVAKVFQSRKDLQSQQWAVEVQQNIANAIKHATEIWNVDMIIMSFGFEGKIGIINKAMTNARKLDKPPLFFAATRNDGANKRIAWPASDHHAFGVSSTDGNGAPSPYNPDEDGAAPILYAFGEGVTVNRPAGNPKLTVTHISGTSFAAPTAAALAANLISFVRLALLASSDEDRVIYAEVPEQLEEIGGLLRVMQRCMMKKHSSGKMSLLPWDFLNKARVDGNAILKDVSDTLNGA
ncbi:hypothetical protein VHEMI06615 [[Torrubiella] hemipterigena]|uniref:Uncharacterized protein n=1 Tax=[Torrubiella] hemipterigena TaxID=1531966 RepID=A0A0A1TLE7_9HYPO|nr:hypothetical protein VHEMI06615 [[Torrubiella] hemipterigena]